MSEHQEEEKKREFRYNAVTGVVIAVLAVLSVVGIVQYKRANELEQSMENQYVRSFHDMADYVRDVDVLTRCPPSPHRYLCRPPPQRLAWHSCPQKTNIWIRLQNFFPRWATIRLIFPARLLTAGRYLMRSMRR